MNVTCPSCTTIYRVDPAKVPAAGVRARCKVCSAIFPVTRTAAAETVSAVAGAGHGRRGADLEATETGGGR